MVFRVLAPVGVQSSSGWLSSGCTVWEKVLGENLEASALGPLDCGSGGASSLLVSGRSQQLMHPKVESVGGATDGSCCPREEDSGKQVTSRWWRLWLSCK